MSYTSNRHDSFIALVIGATIAAIVWAICWASVSFHADSEQRKVDVIQTCQEADDPELCLAQQG